MNKHNFPTEMPAVGGWYFDEKAGKCMFLMPPYPGVDDAVMTPAGLAYRKLAERDRLKVISQGPIANNGLVDRPGGSV